MNKDNHMNSSKAVLDGISSLHPAACLSAQWGPRASIVRGFTGSQKTFATPKASGRCLDSGAESYI